MVIMASQARDEGSTPFRRLLFLVIQGRWVACGESCRNTRFSAFFSPAGAASFERSIGKLHFPSDLCPATTDFSARTRP